MAEEAESKSAILNTNEESVESKPNFDVKLSGSTVCTVLFDGNRVHCANAGDSRAIKVQILL
jgi:serine/threonine protein phosphatase PrpC|tara:strand:- start:766 stop:951 length:186 start_codon:yes stop_codon:yes gene_type:complete